MTTESRNAEIISGNEKFCLVECWSRKQYWSSQWEKLRKRSAGEHFGDRRWRWCRREGDSNWRRKGSGAGLLLSLKTLRSKLNRRRENTDLGE